MCWTVSFLFKHLLYSSDSSLWWISLLSVLWFLAVSSIRIAVVPDVTYPVFGIFFKDSQLSGCFGQSMICWVDIFLSLLVPRRGLEVSGVVFVTKCIFRFLVFLGELVYIRKRSVYRFYVIGTARTEYGSSLRTQLLLRSWIFFTEVLKSEYFINFCWHYGWEMKKALINCHHLSDDDGSDLWKYENVNVKCWWRRFL